MKRGGFLRRKTWIRRRTPLRQKNPERLARLRKQQFGPQAALARTLPCLVEGCPWPTVPAHAIARGMGGARGKDKDVVPLCWDHHEEQHKGIRTFERKYRLDLEAEARALAREVRRQR